VDDPAAHNGSPAWAGTTLAGPQTFAITNQKNLTINHSDGADLGLGLLDPLCRALGFDPLSCGIYRRGWGGVSSLRPLPFYQFDIPGIRRTASGQTQLDLLANAPCIRRHTAADSTAAMYRIFSLNSDPDTGYQVYYTDDQMVFGNSDRLGGTSFLPPLNSTAVTALFDQAVGHRVGLLQLSRCTIWFATAPPTTGAKRRFGTSPPGTIGTITRMPDMTKATGLGVP